MHVIFCSDPMNLRTPDPSYIEEVRAAEGIDIEYSLISYEHLVDEKDTVRAIRRAPVQDVSKLALYRGWMLRPETYTALYKALLERGLRLINDPPAYKHCHYLPESYSIISEHTPKSVWLQVQGDISIDAIMQLLQPFKSNPIIVKDFVKSRKHEWNEACYISSASDRAEVARTVERFIELQGTDLSEGLVFREFLEFEPLAIHSKSGMPMTKEYRVFFLDGKPIYTTRYWEEGVYDDTVYKVIPIPHLMEVASQVQSHFFTMDIAKQIDGDWTIVELGDAQVAGLPETADVRQFYGALADNWVEDNN